MGPVAVVLEIDVSLEDVVPRAVRALEAELRAKTYVEAHRRLSGRVGAEDDTRREILFPRGSIKDGVDGAADTAGARIVTDREGECVARARDLVCQQQGQKHGLRGRLRREEKGIDDTLEVQNPLEHSKP